MLRNMLPEPTNAWQDEMLDDLDELDASSKIIAEPQHGEQPPQQQQQAEQPGGGGGGALRSLQGGEDEGEGEVEGAIVATGPRARRAPPYLQRKHFIPRELEDYDGGGAFPEIHVPQYPLKMGLRQGSKHGQTLAMEVDENGEVKYDAIVKQGMRKNTWVHSGFEDVVEKNPDREDLELPDEEAVQSATERTKRELEKLVDSRIRAAKPTSQILDHDRGKKKGPTFLRYTPQQAGGAHTSGARQRVVSLVEVQTDPLEPPRHKHKKVPGGIPSPPPPVQHSPPRKLTAQDQRDWKIPACVSNWKNPKGYTIPLDKRMASDGSGVQETSMNNHFGQFVEALYIAERNAREEVRRRNELVKKKMLKEKEEMENKLKQLASETRKERAALVGEGGGGGDDDARQREMVRSQRKREREDDRREAMKKSKTSRDRERDISEKIALGQAGKMTHKGESLYDSRLFNQDQGAGGNMEQDDAYNVYDKPLMSNAANQLYRPNQARIAEFQDGEDEGMVESLLDRSAAKPDKGFKGASASSGRRDRPVEFEREDEVAPEEEEEEGNDPFGLEDYLHASKGRDSGGSRRGAGHMSAAAGGSMGESSRSKVNFKSGN